MSLSCAPASSPSRPYPTPRKPRRSLSRLHASSCSTPTTTPTSLTATSSFSPRLARGDGPAKRFIRKSLRLVLNPSLHSIFWSLWQFRGADLGRSGRFIAHVPRRPRRRGCSFYCSWLENDACLNIRISFPHFPIPTKKDTCRSVLATKVSSWTF
jgi:hypothetical protein